MKLEEKKLSQQDIFSGVVFDITVDQVELPNRATAFREVVWHNGGVAVLAIDDDDNIFMVRQFRYGAGGIMLELPAGKLEKGENPAECGIRELREETGMLAGSYEHLLTMHPTPAYCSEKIEIYIARDLTQSEQSLDKDEFLNVERVAFSQALEWCLDGTVTDAKTLAGILKFACLRAKG